jgi:DNA-binding response OmpR family regulator
MLRTLIVEDEVSLRNDLVAFLEAKGYAATGAASLAEASRRMEAERFDLVVLDLGLPDGNGIDLLADIRNRYGLACGVVILTSHQDLEDKIQALETGSDAYLIKHASLREIECTLRNVLKRLPNAAPQLWRLDRSQWSLAAPSGNSVSLTPNEMTFLVMLATSGAEVCDHGELAAALGEGGVFTTANLNTLVRRLRRKVEETTGQVPPIRVAYGKGYVFSAPLAVL